MRRSSLRLGALVIAISTGAAAQSWIEYASIEDRFHAVFPVEPSVEEVEWISEDASVVSGRRYSAVRGDNLYSLTVFDYRDSSFGNMRGSMAHIATSFRQRGEVTLDAYAQLDRIPGHQLQLTEPSGRELYVAVHLHGWLLYVTESSVPFASPRGTMFQHSLSITDENGVRVRYNRDGTRNYERQLGD
jgi:hypothetical protein